MVLASPENDGALAIDGAVEPGCCGSGCLAGDSFFLSPPHIYPPWARKPIKKKQLKN
jgi:hypothetical protein